MNVRIAVGPGPEGQLNFDNIVRVSFVNSDSFGPGQKVGNLTEEGLNDVEVDEAVLVVNVNSFVAMEVTPC